MPPDSEVLKLMEEARRELLAREAALKGNNETSVLQRTLDLVRTRRMCINTLASAYVSFAIAGSYFGMTFDMTQLSSSPHLAAALSGLAEAPAAPLFLLMNHSGRKLSMALCLFVPAVCMFLTLAMKNGTYWMVLGLIAKVFITGAFNMIGVYVSEFMPTQLRGLALGLREMSTRIGGAASPFVVDLVSGLHELAPSAVFGAVALLASLATLLLPETVGQPMPETVADVEAVRWKRGANDPATGDARKLQGISNDAMDREDRL